MIGKKTHGLWLVAALLAGAVVHADASSIVMDGGFESGTAGSYGPGAIGDGWVVTAGTGAICNNDGSGCGNAGDAHSGDQMAFLDWSNSLDTITQTLTTVAGQTYTIDYFVAGTQANFLEVTFGGSTLFDGTSPTGGVGSSDYVEYTYTATAMSTSTVLAFSGERSAGGEILLDDVSVSAVPEPATWPLTCGALLGLVVLRWRFKSLKTPR